MNNPDFIKYNLIYSAYRFALNIGIFVLSFLLLRHFTTNQWLLYLSLIFISLAMGNGINDSDFTLHTYIDAILYLFAALIIIEGRNGWYIVLLTSIGAINRETCLLIPFLYLISDIDWAQWKLNKYQLFKFPIPKWKTILITAASAAVFITLFVLIRWHYGYEPQTQWKVPAGLPMLKLNLLSAIGIKSIFEMIGMFAVLPFICIYKFRSLSYRLQIWFLGIVPIWFLVHWLAVVAYQSRLFLVPTLIIFLPIIIELIEKSWAESHKVNS